MLLFHLFFVYYFLFLSTISVNGAKTDRTVKAQAKGNPQAVITVKSGRTTNLNPLRSVENITLWCQAQAGNETLAISSAAFIRKKDGSILEAILSDDRKRAYHHFDLASVMDAGNYTCKINTTNDLSVNGNHQIFVRPVILADEFDRYESIDEEPFHFSGKSLSAVVGSAIRIPCPIIAFPKASRVWKKDSNDLSDDERYEFASDGSLEISKITYEDAGAYECVARNRFKSNGDMEEYEVKITRQIRAKSPLAWLWPLLTICLILILLIIIIVICELRKKKKHQKLMEAENDD